VIQSFVHKGLRLFFETGSTSGIQAKHERRLKLILTTLDAATEIHDMGLPGFGLHPLKGNRKGLWSVVVNGNWRVVFRLENGHAYVVDYLDYH
jgi:proteic killer suppression protein